MLKEYKKLNQGPITGKPVYGTIEPNDLIPGDSKVALEAVKQPKISDVKKRDKTVQITEIKRGTLNRDERNHPLQCRPRK